MMKRISMATIKLVKQSGTSVRGLKAEQLENIIHDIFRTLLPRYKSQDMDIFPLLLFMSAADSKILSKDLGVINDSIQNRLDHPYKSRPSRGTQRLQALEFLKNVLDIYCTSPEIKRSNWELFLHVYGSTILSKEERDLWMKILDELRTDLTEEHPLPSIELICSASEYWDDCIPVIYPYLYCYEVGIVSRGAFMSFLKIHPDVIKTCALEPV